ncbi:hypothetical protein OEZ85_006758 [Tetradesmus obliquus]|uniref:DNA 3'-5' helicase n=1 Tax=Tetradesmus obliquus TaxID=3088 RepID=A0ABY8TVL6_TETOB|nr:hypothetical protein OEZ85_006758 [Tetradesmus obliquus]
MPQQVVQAAPAADQHDDTLKAVRDMPTPFQQLYSYRYFNPVQSECFDVAYKSDINMVVSAPTGAGKTGVMELAILRLLSKHLTPAAAPHPHMQQPQQVLQALKGRNKVVYIGPIKALVQERQADWQQRFGTLGLRCVQLTGDVDDDNLEDELERADIICTTPEKFDQVSRTVFEKGSPGFLVEIALVLVDEVHLLNEAGRGSALEAGCICRLKAIAALPEMAKAPLGSVRFVAVSATIPNVADLARWLQVPPQGLRQYGDELRPCKLTTHVKGYNAAKNDFLFERRLNEYVYGIVRDYSNGRPALVFCNSRKGTMDTAAVLVKGAEADASARGTFPGSAGTGSTFVKSQAQLQRLQAAAARAQAKALAVALAAGVGFHNAAMERTDRELVEGLFKANDLAVLCTTSTLAMGVNLPAHLVVLKGTTRYAGEAEAGPGEAAGHKEYTQTEVLQMVGRAGRPQFDTEGVAVIMTCRDSISRYQKLLAGQPVESCLMSNLAEHMNAEIVLGTIKDVPGAIQWIKSSFLFTRVRSNPQHYGLKVRPGMAEAELEGLLRDELVLKPVGQLMRYGLLATDEDSYSLAATGPGRLMANHFLKLNTMAAIVSLGQRPNMPSLLRVICGAEEFRATSLRRCERKALNDINHSNDTQALRYPVMATNDDGSSTGKVKQRITSAQEKLFILLNDGLADKPAETLDYSLKQEQDRLLMVGQRIAKCMARYYVLQNSFSAAGRSLLLARSLRVRLWDDSNAAVRQLPSVGKLLGARLAAAGLGSLKALAACNDAHQVEVAAQKPYPWGSELLAHLRSITPPPVTMQLQVLQVLPNGALNSASERKTLSSFTPCKLLCGCSSTDQLLLMRSMVLETFESPMQLHFKVDAPADPSQPINLAARLVLDRVVGLDEKSSLQVPVAYTAMRQGAGPAGAVAQVHTAGGSMHDAALPAADASGLAAEADGGYGVGGGELVTPPRQMLRGSSDALHAGSEAEAAGSSLRHGSASSYTAHWSAAQRQRLGASGAWHKGLDAGVAAEMEQAVNFEDAEIHPAAPNLQQFAFAAGNQPPAAPAAFRPSQDSLMFQRSSQASASSRASAQARLTSKPGGSRSSSATNQFEECTSLIDRILTNTSGSSEYALYVKALIQRQRGNIQESLKLFQQATALNPHNVANLKQIGAVHAERGELEQALSTYLEALEHSPENPEILTTLGLTFLRLGDNQRAFDHLGSSMLHDPKNARTILAAGSIIQDHQDMDVALVKYRVAAAASPNCPQLWNNIGMCFFGKQRYIAAIACLKRALYLDPFEWLVAYNLGLLHLSTGQAASAFHYFSTAINLKPEFAHSYMYLGVALTRLEDHDNAAAAYRKAVSLEPAEPLFHLNYAIMLYNQGDAESARQSFMQFRQLAAGMSEDAKAADAEMMDQQHALAQLLGLPQGLDG